MRVYGTENAMCTNIHCICYLYICLFMHVFNSYFCPQKLTEFNFINYVIFQEGFQNQLFWNRNFSWSSSSFRFHYLSRNTFN